MYSFKALLALLTSSSIIFLISILVSDIYLPPNNHNHGIICNNKNSIADTNIKNTELYIKIFINFIA